MLCVCRKNMANDPRTNLFVITKVNGLSKLQGFLKHGHFACKLAEFTFLIKRQHFLIQKFRKNKGKKSEQITCILIYFN